MAKKKINSAFMKEHEISEELEDVVGAGPMSRPEITKKIWVYIKKHKLNEGRTINPDRKLAEVLGNKPLDMLKIATKLKAHILAE